MWTDRLLLAALPPLMLAGLASIILGTCAAKWLFDANGGLSGIVAAIVSVFP